MVLLEITRLGTTYYYFIVFKVAKSDQSHCHQHLHSFSVDTSCEHRSEPRQSQELMTLTLKIIIII